MIFFSSILSLCFLLYFFVLLKLFVVSLFSSFFITYFLTFILEILIKSLYFWHFLPLRSLSHYNSRLRIFITFNWTIFLFSFYILPLFGELFVFDNISVELNALNTAFKPFYSIQIRKTVRNSQVSRYSMVFQISKGVFSQKVQIWVHFVLRKNFFLKY